MPSAVLAWIVPLVTTSYGAGHLPDVVRLLASVPTLVSLLDDSTRHALQARTPWMALSAHLASLPR